jgi:hypothetical protein
MAILFTVLLAVLVLAAALAFALPPIGAGRQPRLVAASEMPLPDPSDTTDELRVGSLPLGRRDPSTIVSDPSTGRGGG